MRLFAQLVLSMAMVQFVPVSTPAIEQAHLPEARDGRFVISEVSELISPHLPIDRGARAPEKIDPESFGVVTTAKSALVVDRASGAVLFEKNADEVRSIGSITKLITALTFLNTHPDLTASASVIELDLRSGGRDHLYLDDPVTVGNLLEASLVGSDNPATVSLSRLSGLSVEEFAKAMNDQAKHYGMKSSYFVEPTGLDPRNVSTTRDLVLLLEYVLEDPTLRSITEKVTTSFRSASGREYVIPTTDLLLSSYLNVAPYKVLGGKTGFLPSAGYCLGVGIRDESGHEVFSIVLGSDTLLSRFQEVKGLTQWAFDTYRWPDEL